VCEVCVCVSTCCAPRYVYLCARVVVLGGERVCACVCMCVVCVLCVVCGVCVLSLCVCRCVVCGVSMCMCVCTCVYMCSWVCVCMCVCTCACACELTQERIKLFLFGKFHFGQLRKLKGLKKAAHTLR
jgi:hypothetical protein